MIYVILVGFTLFCLWLTFSFLEVPPDNQFDAKKYWEDKERKWGQK